MAVDIVEARLGQARRGEARLGWAVEARLGEARRGMARLGGQYKNSVEAFWSGSVSRVSCNPAGARPRNQRRAIMAKATGIMEAIEVEPLRVGSMSVWLKGRTPLICNRMAGKAMRELLCPRGRKSKAEKEQSLKHDPLNEFRNSMSLRVGKGSTRLVFPAPAVKGAMAAAALETKGTNKTQIGRLVWVQNYTCDLYGVPQLLMSVVRSADMNKTPDVRTRAILAEWCLPVVVQFVKPQMTENTIAQLLSNGGIIVGIGDFRQEKGKGNFGQFEVATEADCKAIMASGGIKQQDAALKAPTCFDAESEELLGWFSTEVGRRGQEAMLTS